MPRRFRVEYQPWTEQPPTAQLRPEWLASAALVSMPGVRPKVVANANVAYPPGERLTPALSPIASITGVGVQKSSGSFGLLRASGSFEANVEIPAGSDWTFMALFTPSGYTGTNSGLWRNDTGSLGQSFVAYEGSTRLWVRQNGSNYYGTSARPAAGKQTSIVVSVNSGSRIRAFVNGIKELDSSAVATADMTGDNGIFRYGSQSGEEINGNFELLGFWKSARYTDSDLSELGKNPYGMLFAPRRIIIPVSAVGGGGNVTLALTGQAVASAAGTLDDARTVAAAGSAATVSAGTLAPTAGKALAGTSVAASAGTVVPSISQALAGASVASSAGTLDDARTVAIAGQSVTAAAGAITYSAGTDLTLALSGAQITVAGGSLGNTRTVAFAGQAATALAGTLGVIVAGDVTVALSGVVVNVQAGTLTAPFTGEVPAGGGSAIRARLLRRFADDEERRRAKAKLPALPKDAREALRQAAADVAQADEVTPEAVEQRISEALSELGQPATEAALDWMLYFLRVQADAERIAQAAAQRAIARAMREDDEEAALLLLMA